MSSYCYHLEKSFRFGFCDLNSSESASFPLSAEKRKVTTFSMEEAAETTTYPKVKVSNQDPDDDQSGSRVMSTLQIVDTSEASQNYSSADQVKDPPPTVIKVLKHETPIRVPPVGSESQGTGKDDKKVDESPIPKAATVLRPRAVLSSPYNDTLIGTKNKIKADRTSALRNHNAIQNRHVQARCSIKPTIARTENPISTNATSTLTTDAKGDLEGKVSGRALPSRKSQVISKKAVSTRT